MEPERITGGRSLSKEYFKLLEFSNCIDGDAIVALLTGKVAACIFRDAVPRATCDVLVRNFWRNPGRKERSDGVPGHFVGAYHYGKETAAYMREVCATKPDIDEFYSGVEDPSERVRSETKKALAVKGINLRAAMHDGITAAGSRALCWTAPGKFLLDPHDDIAQLGDPVQSGFEIQAVRNHTVVAVNIYPHVHPRSGRYLQIWNIQPDDACRRRLNLQHTGYPYSEAHLAEIESMVVTVNTGDVCLFNGGQVHAVVGELDELRLHERRLLITFFMGLRDDSTAVWWT